MKLITDKKVVRKNINVFVIFSVFKIGVCQADISTYKTVLIATKIAKGGSHVQELIQMKHVGIHIQR